MEEHEKAIAPTTMASRVAHRCCGSKLRSCDDETPVEGASRCPVFVGKKGDQVDDEWAKEQRVGKVVFLVWQLRLFLRWCGFGGLPRSATFLTKDSLKMTNDVTREMTMRSRATINIHFSKAGVSHGQTVLRFGSRPFERRSTP